MEKRRRNPKRLITKVKSNRTIRLKEPRGAPSISPISRETPLNIPKCLFSRWLRTVKERKVKLLSRVRLFATPGTAAYHAPWSMGFSRQEYWSGLPSPSLRTVKERTKKIIHSSEKQKELSYLYSKHKYERIYIKIHTQKNFKTNKGIRWQSVKV